MSPCDVCFPEAWTRFVSKKGFTLGGPLVYDYLTQTVHRPGHLLKESVLCPRPPGKGWG